MQHIGVDFKLRVYSKRWDHKDNYTITKTEDGWNVTIMKPIDGKGDKHANPALEKALRGESISYPHDLGYFLSDIWDASESKSIEEIQGYFDELGEWISRTEETKPNFNPFYA